MWPSAQKILIPENKDGKSHDAPWDGVFCQITASGEVRTISVTGMLPHQFQTLRIPIPLSSPPPTFLVFIFNWWCLPKAGGYLYLLPEEPIFYLLKELKKHSEENGNVLVPLLTTSSQSCRVKCRHQGTLRSKTSPQQHFSLCWIYLNAPFSALCHVRHKTKTQQTQQGRFVSAWQCSPEPFMLCLWNSCPKWSTGVLEPGMLEAKNDHL